MKRFTMARRSTPTVNRSDFANRAVLNRFHTSAIVSVGMNLVAQASDHIGLLRLQRHLTSFPDVMSQRLLTINVFALPHDIQSDEGVHVVRSRHSNGIDRVAEFRHHLTEILKHRGVWIQLPDLGRPSQVDIAKPDKLCLVVAGHF